jgi:hypothetical protein
MDIKNGLLPATFPEIMDEQLEILAALFKQTWNGRPESRPDIEEFLLLLDSALHRGSERQSEDEERIRSTTSAYETEINWGRESVFDIASPYATSLEPSPQSHVSSPGSPSDPEKLDDTLTSQLISYRTSWLSMGWYQLRQLWDIARSRFLEREQNFTAGGEMVSTENYVIPSTALIWLANSLEESASSEERLSAVIDRQLVELLAERLMEQGLNNVHAFREKLLAQLAEYDNISRRAPEGNRCIYN